MQARAGGGKGGSVSFTDVAIWTAVLAGALLRWAMLGHGLWRDEASSVFDAWGGTAADVVRRVSISELNPPGYFLALHSWLMLVPLSDVLLKIPSALASLALVPLSVMLGARVGGKRLAVAAAWCAALAPMDLYYAQEARPYMFEAVFVTLAAIALVDIVRGANCRLAPWYGTASVMLAILTQYTGILFAATYMLIWAWTLRNLRTVAAWRPWLVSLAALALTTAVLIPALHVQMGAGLSWEAHPKLIAYPVIAVRDMLVLLPLDWWPLHEAMKALLVAVVAVDLFFAARRMGGVPVPGGKGGAVLLVLALATAVLEVPISNGGRYMVPFAPLFWIVLMAWLCMDRPLPRAVPAGAVIAGFLALIAFFDVSVIRHDRGTYKSAASQLLALDTVASPAGPLSWPDATTPVIVAPDMLAPTVAYYLRSLHPPLYGFARWDDPQIFRPGGYARIWNDPAAVGTAVARVEQWRKAGIPRIALLSHPTEDSGSLPYQRAETFVRAVRAAYHCNDRIELGAKIEPLTIEICSLTRH